MKAVLREHTNGGGSLQFRYNPDAIDVLKACRWRWDPEQRFWWAWPDDLDSGLRAMERLGYQIIDTLQREQQTQHAADPDPVVSRVDFYEAMLRRLPPEDRTAKYRDLMRAFHPDACGDSEEAKAINAAWDRVRGRGRRGA